MLTIDAPLVEKVLSAFIQDFVRKNGYAKGIVGVSGGLDSAVVLALTRQALGRENTHALLLPYRLSSPRSLSDGQRLCESLGVASEVIDISPSIDAYFQIHPTSERLLIGNKCARERMSVLYDHSARKKALVIGTSNKSELLIGYSTVYGDSAAAILPIGDLYKTQVFQLAIHLGIPNAIITKVPSADLWSGQTDEGEIGITYQELDEILIRLIDQRKSQKEIEKEGFPAALIKKIIDRIMASQFKRTLPPIAKLQSRTVGIDFRYPHDWNK